MSAASDQLLQQAFQARQEHRPNDAKRDLVEAVDLCLKEMICPRVELARALTGLGQIERDLDHVEAALYHYEEALALYRAEGDVLRVAHTVRHIGDMHRHEGRLELAATCYREALGLYRPHAETQSLDLANAIRGLAILKGDTGETEQARALWEEARHLYLALHVEAGVAESTRRLALLAR
jgi:tetratricopeptide (TPR) repeat protein